MKIIGKQKGATFWGFIWGVVLFICMTYLIVIGLPPYPDNQKLKRALVYLAEDDQVMRMSRRRMISALNRKLNIDYGDDIVNLDRAFKVRNADGRKALSINYEVVVPVVYNISLLLDFKNEVIAPIK